MELKMDKISKIVRKSDIQISEQLPNSDYELIKTITTTTIKGYGIKIVRKITNIWRHRFARR